MKEGIAVRQEDDHWKDTQEDDHGGEKGDIFYTGKIVLQISVLNLCHGGSAEPGGLQCQHDRQRHDGQLFADGSFRRCDSEPDLFPGAAAVDHSL